MPRISSKRRSAAKKSTKRRSMTKSLKSRQMSVYSGGAAVAGLPMRKLATMQISRTMRDVTFTGALDTIVTDNGGAQVTQALFFTLDQVAGWAEFKPLFEEYRIDEVKVAWIPCFAANVSRAANVSFGAQVEIRVPQLGFCANYTGTGVPATTTENEWLECEGYEQHDFNKIITAKIKPKVLNQAYSSSFAIIDAFTVADESKWIPITYADVRHYGIMQRVYDPYYDRLLHGVSDPTGTMYVTYTISFRGPK